MQSVKKGGRGAWLSYGLHAGPVADVLLWICKKVEERTSTTTTVKSQKEKRYRWGIRAATRKEG